MRRKLRRTISANTCRRMATDKQGVCCICGTDGKLSFEHVPPRSAFNDHRVFEADIEKLMEGKWAPGERPTEGNWKEKGAGRYSLCMKCNNDTGS
jgi:5-methylcytosine-specific restriction endonuclease McrA